MVRSTFSRSGWSVVRSASLAKEDTSKKRPSPHLRQVPIQSNKVSPRTFQTALVFSNRGINKKTWISPVLYFDIYFPPVSMALTSFFIYCLLLVDNVHYSNRKGEVNKY